MISFTNNWALLSVQSETTLIPVQVYIQEPWAIVSVKAPLQNVCKSTKNLHDNVVYIKERGGGGGGGGVQKKNK